MTEKNLTDLISHAKWSIITNEFSLADICLSLNFKDSMALAYDLFFKNHYDDEIQDFGVRLFFSIRENYPEWNIDWKNDAFLGKLCSITWRYDEMYECYKRAYDKLTDPPDSLLLLLASCNSAPGTPPISDEEAEKYLKRAIDKKLTYEAALKMRGVTKDPMQKNYWDLVMTDLENNNIHTETIIPDILSLQNRR